LKKVKFRNLTTRFWVSYALNTRRRQNMMTEVLLNTVKGP